MDWKFSSFGPDSPTPSSRVQAVDTTFIGPLLNPYILLFGGHTLPSSTMWLDEFAFVPTRRARRISPLSFESLGHSTTSRDTLLARAWQYRQALRRERRRSSIFLRNFSAMIPSLMKFDTHSQQHAEDAVTFIPPGTDKSQP